MNSSSAFSIVFEIGAALRPHSMASAVLRSPDCKVWPRKSLLTPLQSKVRLDICLTVTGASVIVLENA